MHLDLQDFSKYWIFAYESRLIPEAMKKFNNLL